MKYLLLTIVPFLCLLFFISCKDDSCNDNSSYLTQVETENTNWRTADSLYNVSKTIENCKELNRVTELYITTLKSINDCVSETETVQFNNQLNFLETSLIEDCN